MVRARIVECRGPQKVKIHVNDYSMNILPRLSVTAIQARLAFFFPLFLGAAMVQLPR
jgi:hypothetical protein